MAAADARITTLNELITEIKFIKFFAWEGKWIDRTLAARHKELVCFVLAGFNNTFFSLMWNLVPNFVSVISFITYIKTGHSLTVPVAFTAIALFQMLQHPLNMIPYFVSSLIKAKLPPLIIAFSLVCSNSALGCFNSPHRRVPRGRRGA